MPRICVTGKAKLYSELYLAVIGPEPLQLRRLWLLEEEFQESNLPMRVDLIDWNAS